jgi:hypothetical protein
MLLLSLLAGFGAPSRSEDWFETLYEKAFTESGTEGSNKERGCRACFRAHSHNPTKLREKDN